MKNKKTNKTNNEVMQVGKVAKLRGLSYYYYTSDGKTFDIGYVTGKRLNILMRVECSDFALLVAVVGDEFARREADAKIGGIL